MHHNANLVAVLFYGKYRILRTPTQFKNKCHGREVSRSVYMSKKQKFAIFTRSNTLSRSRGQLTV